VKAARCALRGKRSEEYPRHRAWSTTQRRLEWRAPRRCRSQRSGRAQWANARCAYATDAETRYRPQSGPGRAPAAGLPAPARIGRYKGGGSWGRAIPPPPGVFFLPPPLWGGAGGGGAGGLCEAPPPLPPPPPPPPPPTAS